MIFLLFQVCGGCVVHFVVVFGLRSGGSNFKFFISIMVTLDSWYQLETNGDIFWCRRMSSDGRRFVLKIKLSSARLARTRQLIARQAMNQ